MKHQNRLACISEMKMYKFSNLSPQRIGEVSSSEAITEIRLSRKVASCVDDHLKGSQLSECYVKPQIPQWYVILSQWYVILLVDCRMELASCWVLTHRQIRAFLFVEPINRIIFQKFIFLYFMEILLLYHPVLSQSELNDYHWLCVVADQTVHQCFNSPYDEPRAIKGTPCCRRWPM
jgi:hypothetical protein